MACCCCDGPGVCCQGTTCTSVNSCECQQTGGAFKKGRQCSESVVCRCSGGTTSRISVCETCPPGCTTTVCSCDVHRSINIRITVSEVLFQWHCGSEQNWNTLKDAFEGDYVLNWFDSPTTGSCAGGWLYEADGLWISASSANYPGGTVGQIQAVITRPDLGFQCGLSLGAFGEAIASPLRQTAPWPCKESPTVSRQIDGNFRSLNGIVVIARGTVEIS
jgi:hypothetical protein